MKRYFKACALITLGLIVCLGFRVIPIGLWNINNLSVANTKLFVQYTEGSSTLDNDLPSGDPLFGSGTLTVDQAMSSIFSDFNNVQGAYVNFVNTADADYNTVSAEDRTIVLKLGSPSGLSSGEAKLGGRSGSIVECDIDYQSSLLDSAKVFIQTMTHELGHCLGLDHAQDTVNAIMSYFSDRDEVRLMLDDKMGLVYLYPVDPEAAKETNTFGMTCQRK